MSTTPTTWPAVLFALTTVIAFHTDAFAQADVALRPPDAFYDPPAELPTTPGALLRSEALTDRMLPEGTRAWRILYTTTLDDNTRAIASATVLAPIALIPGPRPVIAWAHGTLGITQPCAPTLSSTPVMNVPALDKLIEEGWVLVATDYPGLGTSGPHPYMIGEGEARSVLDAVRAARQMPELALEPRTVVWGHSQGGHAALWAGMIAPRYAAEVNVIGVAAAAPATYMAETLAIHAADAVAATLGSFVATAYSQFYRDVEFDDVVRKESRVVARQLANLCFYAHEMYTGQELVRLLGGAAVLANPRKGKLGKRLEQNVPRAAIMAPLLISQGLDDTTVPPSVTQRYVRDRCDAGQLLEYWVFSDLDHSTIVAPGSPFGSRLMKWTKERLAGALPASECLQRKIEKQKGQNDVIRALLLWSTTVW